MPSLAVAELRLAGRAGRYLTLAGLEWAAPSPVPAFQDAIGEALQACGVLLADPSAPTDQDVRGLPSRAWFKFLDVAELRLLETAAGPIATRAAAQRWADYSVAFDLISFVDYLDGKRKAARLKWGYGVAALAAGTVNLNFPERGGVEF